MAKWGTYPPDEQLRLKREAAEEMYEALAKVRVYVSDKADDSYSDREDQLLDVIDAALVKARGEEA